MTLEFRGGLVGGIKEVQQVRSDLAEIFPRSINFGSRDLSYIANHAAAKTVGAIEKNRELFKQDIVEHKSRVIRESGKSPSTEMLALQAVERNFLETKKRLFVKSLLELNAKPDAVRFKKLVVVADDFFGQMTAEVPLAMFLGARDGGKANTAFDLKASPHFSFLFSFGEDIETYQDLLKNEPKGFALVDALIEKRVYGIPSFMVREIVLMGAKQAGEAYKSFHKIAEEIK